MKRRFEEPRLAPTCGACSLLVLSAEAVVLFNPGRRVIEWNPTAEKLYGYRRKEVLGRLLKTVPRGREEEFKMLMDKVKHGEKVYDLETKRLARNGEEIDVSINLSYFHDPQTHKPYFIEVAKDIREKIKLRQWLIEMEKLTSMGKMAAGTAHHLNTPLTSMLLRVQMIKERFQDPLLQSELDRLEGGIKFCQEFVQKLLQFARRTSMEKKSTELRELVDSVITFFKPTLKVRKVNVILDESELRGKRILADRSQIEALLSAILMNAIDAMPDGGEIRVASRLVNSTSFDPAQNRSFDLAQTRFHQAQGNPQIEISITDNGIGIPEKHLPHIFEPFYTTKESGKGTGLGLSIAQNIVLEHDGSITVVSKEGKGTTVSIRFPLFQYENLEGKINGIA
jgi:PAS domain S-box-containing protein